MIPREPSRSGPPTQTRQVTIGVVSETGYSREALVKCLAQRSHTIAVDLGCGDRETFDRVRHLKPQVLLLDLRPSHGHAREILRLSPDTRVVALGVSDEEAEALSLAEAGVAGFIPRQSLLEDLFVAIDKAFTSEVTCSPNSPSLNRGDVRLTGRERQILRLVDQGLTNKEISQSLAIELPTVKNHVHHILEKLAVHKRGEAAARARGGASLRPMGQEPGPR